MCIFSEVFIKMQILTQEVCGKTEILSAFPTSSQLLLVVWQLHFELQRC